MNTTIITFFLLLVSLCCPLTAQTPNNTEIVFGMSGSLSGHFSFYGNTIKGAIDACFAQANDSGGIQGKKLRLICHDDHGDAQSTQNNIKKLHEKDGIDMFVGVMGTRGILSLLPLIREQKIALFFPWGGDVALKDPNLTHIINGLGWLEPQLEVLSSHLVTTLRFKKVAIFHADDDFSSNAASALAQRLKDAGTTPLHVEQYNRFTMDIHTPAHQLMKVDPKLVICLSTSSPAVKLINYFFERGHFGTQFLGIDSTFLVPEILKNKGASFHFSSSVPNPQTTDIPLAAAYKQALAQFTPDAEPSVLSFAYYISATILVRALKNISGEITKEKIIQAIEAMRTFDLDGFSINFNPNNRHIFGHKTWII